MEHKLFSLNFLNTSDLKAFSVIYQYIDSLCKKYIYIDVKKRGKKQGERSVPINFTLYSTNTTMHIIIHLEVNRSESKTNPNLNKEKVKMSHSYLLLFIFLFFKYYLLLFYLSNIYIVLFC